LSSAIRRKRRSVHAYACGELVAADWIENKTAAAIAWAVADDSRAAACVTRVSYNPFRAGTFMAGDTPIHAAPAMNLTGDAKAACYV